MARFKKFFSSRKESNISARNLPPDDLISRVLRYCCPCCLSPYEPKKPSNNMAGEDRHPKVTNMKRNGRDASSDHPTDLIKHASPDDNPPVSNNQMPQTGSTTPQDNYKSRNGDDKAAKSSTGTPTPGSDQEQAPAQGNQMIEKEIEDKHPSSQGSIKPRDELKASDPRKMHGKGYDYDNSPGSPQATKANQMIEKELEDKLHASSHGSVKHRGELKSSDIGNKYPSSHGSIKPKGELKPIDRGSLGSQGYGHDDSDVSQQATKDANNSKQQIESHHISPQVNKDASNSKQQIEKHQEVTRGVKGKRNLVDGDLQDDISKVAAPSKIALRTDRFGLLNLERLD